MRRDRLGDSWRNFSKRVASFATLAALCLISGVASAQNIKVSGRVIDSDTKQPLVGVTIVIQGSSKGTTTGTDGKYTISAPKNATLSFSFIGYETAAVPVNGKTLVNVTMKPSATDLDEVVVIGYGTARKSEVTGSISSIGAKDINKTVITSVDQALQGNASGVLVINTSAEPGGEVTIRIRGGSSISGENEPLVVVDGFPTDKSVLSLLSPNDIKSMEVLKDAAATAIYGSQGANGVIMITTKSGQEGKVSVSLDINQGISTPRRYIPMMDGPQFARYGQAAMINSGQNMLGRNGNASYTYMPDTLGTFDAQRMIIKDMANRGDYSVQISGGKRGLNYYISGGYLREEGLLNNSSNDRLSFRSKFNIDLASNVKLTLNAAVSQNTVKSIIGGSDGGAIMRTLLIKPNTSTKGDFIDGVFYDPETGEPTSISTEVAIAMNNNRKRKTFYTDINGLMRWSINKYFTLSVSAGYRYTETNNYGYVPADIFQQQAHINRYVSANRDTRGTGKWINENVLNWNRKFGKHSFNAILGQSWEQTKNESFGVKVYGFDYDFGWDNLGASTFTSTTEPTSNYYGNQLISFFTRVMYNWNQRYHVTLSMRADGSSRFGPDKRFGYFPSASLMWNVTQEDFAKNWSTVSMLKVRASYGVTGNQSISNYLSQSQLSQGRVIIDNVAYGGVQTNTIGNDDLQWETTAQYNVGADLELLDGRISMALDAYYKKTYNLLYSYRIPGLSGYSTVMKNIGNIDNKGIEFEFTSRNIQTKNFSWTTSFNIGYNKNTVTDLGGNDNVVLYRMSGVMTNDITYLKIGQPLGTIMGHKTTIFKDWNEVYSPDAFWVEDPNNIPTTPGMIRYYDRNGDGMIDDNDRVKLGQVQPYLMGGFTTTFTYKNLDFTLFFNGAYGNSIVDGNTGRLDRWQGNQYGQTRKGLNSFRPYNFYTGEIGYSVHAKYPVPAMYTQSSTAKEYQAMFNNYWVQDGSYLRLKTVTIGYTFPEKITKKIGMKGLRIAFSGTNLLTFTNYLGMDPEMSSSVGSSNSKLGIDQSSYPAARLYTLNVNFKF